MTLVELVSGVAAYLLSSLSLGLAAWAVAEKTLPRPARLGLRLLAVVAGEMVFCAVLVQALGLLGLLTVPWYLAASLAPGIGVLWLWRARRPHEAFFRLFRRAFRLWIAAPAWGLGWLGALFLLYLAKRFFFLPRDIDALSLHGPMIAEWIQSGRLSLGSFWNYPQCWEYQFVPSYLLLRSDVLVVVPGLLAVVAILLAVRELAARLSLGGQAGHLLAVLVAAMPILWRDPLKNDPVFAFSLLLGLLAIDRAARRRPGSFWLGQLAIFLVLGTKPTGFLYAGALGGAGLALYWWQNRDKQWTVRLRGLLPGLLVTLLFQASACAVQVRNVFVNGNPVYPLRVELLGREILPGTGSVAGTSILENAGLPEVWKQFLLIGGLLVGAEWPLLVLLLAAAAILGLGSARRLLAARELPLEVILPLVAGLLWGLFLATPWSCGLARGAWQFLGSGSSLRYALAPLALTYLAAAAVVRRFVGRRRLFSLLAVAAPLLLFAKWSHLGLFGESRMFAWKFFPVWMVVAGLGGWLGRWRLAARIGPKTKMAATFALMVVLAAAFARWAEGMRDQAWSKFHRGVWTHISQETSLPFKVAVSDANATYRYFLYGREFENRLVVVDIGREGESGRIPDDISLFYLFAPKGEGQRQRLIAAMSRRGWRVVALPEDRQTALLRRP